MPKKRKRRTPTQKKHKDLDDLLHLSDLQLPDFDPKLPEFDLQLPEFDLLESEDLFVDYSRTLDELTTLKHFGRVDVKLGSEGERRGSPIDVARWMMKELEGDGYLYQQDAASCIADEFGGGFLYWNVNRNPAIAIEVLREFRNLTEETVVWVKSERMWRWREKDDPPGQREVD